MRACVSVCKNTEEEEEEEEEEEDNKKTRENDILKAKYRCLSIFILFIQLCALDYMRYYGSVKSYTHRLRFVSRHLEHFCRTFQSRQCLRQIRRKKASSRERQTE